MRATSQITRSGESTLSVVISLWDPPRSASSFPRKKRSTPASRIVATRGSVPSREGGKQGFASLLAHGDERLLREKSGPLVRARRGGARGRPDSAPADEHGDRPRCLAVERIRRRIRRRAPDERVARRGRAPRGRP